MTNPFVWSEILLYITPVVAVFILYKYKSWLHTFSLFPLNMAIVLTPLWLVLIHLFSLLIFSFSLLPFIIFIIAFLLGLHLFDYIRRIDVFVIQSYYLGASRVVFGALTSFLLGLIILRLITYFI